MKGVNFPSYMMRSERKVTDKQYAELCQLDIPQALLDILVARGYTNDEIANYVNASEDLFEPDAILNMDESGDLILESMRNGDGVGIFGDYDTDGATSTSQLYMYLRDLKEKNERWFSAPLAWKIGERKGGYGPYPAGTKELYDAGCRTLVILDSGTVANDHIEAARGHGFKNIIVVDHHQPGDNWKKPPAIIVNPHQPDCTSGFTELCTAGLVWCLLKHMDRVLSKDESIDRPDIETFAILAAIGSVVDMMPMTGMNRGLVRYGLDLEHHSDGVQSLKVAGNLEGPITSEMCGWQVGPRINSAGRISDSSLGTRLFVMKDDDMYADMGRDEIAAELHRLNEERKGMKNTYVDEAKKKLVGMKPDHGVIILEDESWHPGLVGLVASEPLRKYGLPCIAIGTGGKGSARSNSEFDIGHLLIEARKAGMLLSGGGHAAAGGLTLNPERRQEFFDYVAEKSKDVKPSPEMIDATIECEDVGEHFIRPLEDAMQPIGQQNPSPLFLLRAYVTNIGYTRGGNPKLTVEDETGTARLYAWTKEGPFYDKLKSLAEDSTKEAEFIVRITHIPFTTMVIEDVLVSD